MSGAQLVAMQRNRWWPTADGPALDAGVFVAGLEYAAQVKATVVGKPSPGDLPDGLRDAGRRSRPRR